VTYSTSLVEALILVTKEAGALRLVASIIPPTAAVPKATTSWRSVTEQGASSSCSKK